MLLRLFKHSFTTGLKSRIYFPRKTLERITQAVKESEKNHRGEIRVCIEAKLNPIQILRGISGRDRAVDMFSALRVWDTEENNGVLIYILVADHDIEILSDRGVNKSAPEGFWNDICSEIEKMFREKKFESGILHAVKKIGNFLENKYPREGRDVNELPDRPHLI